MEVIKIICASLSIITAVIFGVKHDAKWALGAVVFFIAFLILVYGH